MNNADKFLQVFGIYATELWAKPEKEFLEWLNASAEPERKKGKWEFVGHQMFECTGCKSVFLQDQFEHMKTRTSDPDFPRFCPVCGSYNGGEEDDI